MIRGYMVMAWEQPLSLYRPITQQLHGWDAWCYSRTVAHQIADRLNDGKLSVNGNMPFIVATVRG